MNWPVNGLSEFDVIAKAGRALFETTRRFY